MRSQTAMPSSSHSVRSSSPTCTRDNACAVQCGGGGALVFYLLCTAVTPTSHVQSPPLLAAPLTHRPAHAHFRVLQQALAGVHHGTSKGVIIVGTSRGAAAPLQHEASEAQAAQALLPLDAGGQLLRACAQLCQKLRTLGAAAACHFIWGGGKARGLSSRRTVAVAGSGGGGNRAGATAARQLRLTRGIQQLLNPA